MYWRGPTGFISVAATLTAAIAPAATDLAPLVYNSVATAAAHTIPAAVAATCHHLHPSVVLCSPVIHHPLLTICHYLLFVVCVHLLALDLVLHMYSLAPSLSISDTLLAYIIIILLTLKTYHSLFVVVCQSCLSADSCYCASHILPSA